jgi:hypothetical protein
MSHEQHRHDNTFLSKILRPFFKLILHYIGLRFYTHDTVVNTRIIGESVFRTIQDKTLKFTFYRKKYEEIRYRRGRTHKVVFYGYMVECVFDTTFPDTLTKYNNMKFTINANFLKYISESEILHILLDFYVKFIHDDLKYQNSGTSAFNELK